MQYTTHIFEKSKKRARQQLLFNGSIALLAILVTAAFFVGFPGVGLIGGITLIAYLIKAKTDNDKFMGINTHGDRKSKLVIAESQLTIDDLEIPYDQVKDLTIYVEEYSGKPRATIGVHHGGNNEIHFLHNGKKYQFNYIIKNLQDYKIVEELVDQIESKYPPKLQ